MPATICRRSGTSTDSAMKTKNTTNSMPQPATTTRFASSGSGTIGSGWRRCCRAKPASRSAASAQPIRLSTSCHAPPWPTRVIGISSAVKPASSNSAPQPSMRAAPRRTGSARSEVSTSTRANSPSGTLIQKIQGHDRCSVSTPPTTGPSMLATTQTVLM